MSKHTVTGLAYEYGVHAARISICKKQLFNAPPAVFSNRIDKILRKKMLW